MLDLLKREIGETGPAHHAYLLVGQNDQILLGLNSFLEDILKIKSSNNSDFISLKFDNFGIDESRKIKEMHETKSWNESQTRYFVISFDFATVEAQNSLLKVFEESKVGMIFFVIVPNKEFIIPTLTSRFYKIDLSSDNFLQNKTHKSLDIGNQAEIKNIAKNFIESKPKNRLDIIKKIIDDIDDGSKTKVDVNYLLDELEILVSKNLPDKKAIFVLEEIMKSKKYILSRSPSIKMILENLALVI